MNKKILIGSIIAITILIGVSFTSVVGYRSVESNVKASPLFNIRTSRAIDEESEELRCEYVGKGEGCNILLLKRNAKRELILRAFERLINMDKKELYKIRDFILNNLDNDKFKLPKQINEGRLQQLFVEYGLINEETPILTEAICFTGQQCTMFPVWDILLCLEMFILTLPFMIVAIPIIAVTGVITLFIAVITTILFFISLFITIHSPICDFPPILDTS